MTGARFPGLNLNIVRTPGLAPQDLHRFYRLAVALNDTETATRNLAALRAGIVPPIVVWMPRTPLLKRILRRGR